MIFTRRAAKKTIYASLFFAILFVLVMLITIPGIANWREPAVRQPDQPVSVIIESVDTVIHTDTADIIARIRNPNPRVGVAEYVVTFVLLDGEGNEISRLREVGYLLPGGLNYFAALNVPLTEELENVRVETPVQVNFTGGIEPDTLPTFNAFLRDRSTVTINANQVIEVQKGIVTNTSAIGFNRVDITGVAFNEQRDVIGVSKTFVGRLDAGEQREFTLEWPSPSTPTERVILLPATNIFSPDNILRPEGDPAGLR